MFQKRSAATVFSLDIFNVHFGIEKCAIEDKKKKKMAEKNDHSLCNIFNFCVWDLGFFLLISVAWLVGWTERTNCSVEVKPSLRPDSAHAIQIYVVAELVRMR